MGDSKLKVHFICGDTSGPMAHDIAWPIQFFHKYNLLQCDFANHLNLDSINKADILVFQRQYAPESLMILKQMKDKGKVCISIVDDNIWNLPASNPAYSTYTGPTLARFEAIVKEAHAVTTSTENLKNKILKFNSNVHVLRNLVDPDIASYKSPGRDVPGEIRIGWTGTPHHHDDSLLVEHALSEACRKYKNVKLVFMGYLPPHIAEMVSQFRIEFYKFVPTDAFYPCLANLDFDIGIAPLVDNQFNACKTARKAQEYGMLSIPMVLSPTVSYEAFVDGETCLKPKKNKHIEWVKCLSYLIENEDKRKEMGEKAHKFVMENHDINKFIEERAQVYIDVYNRVKGTSI